MFLFDKDGKPFVRSPDGTLTECQIEYDENGKPFIRMPDGSISDAIIEFDEDGKMFVTWPGQKPGETITIEYDEDGHPYVKHSKVESASELGEEEAGEGAGDRRSSVMGRRMSLFRRPSTLPGQRLDTRGRRRLSMFFRGRRGSMRPPTDEDDEYGSDEEEETLADKFERFFM